jgi:HYR domain
MYVRFTRKALLLLAAAVLGSFVVAVARADGGSVGTLHVSGTFKNTFKFVECPAGSPATTNCYREANVSDELPGLGKVTVDYTLLQDDFGSACAHVHAQIPIVVSGKGEIDLATRSTGCILPENPAGFPPVAFVVLGGAGLYAGATGSGVLEYKNSERGGGSGLSTIAWSGTLNVAGVAFDTTAPQMTGANGMTAKTRNARGVRVHYSVSAADATDGPVQTACLPASGSRFRIGRTTVTCMAVDRSGNTATATFVINVKRLRR